MLPKGKYPWYAPSLNMRGSAQGIFNKIAQTTDLPHIPSAIMELQMMLFNKDIEISELVKAVKKDPFLATEIIKIADNQKNLRDPDPPPILSLEHAINYIGRANLKNLVLTAGIRFFKLPTDKFSKEAFWQHAFLTAGIAEYLAVKLGLSAEKDQIYLAGCLCNIGKIMTALCFPQECDKIQTIIDDVKTMTTWENAENFLKLPDHCVLGEIGAALWGLPPFVIECARYHHTSEFPEIVDHPNAISVVSLANLLAHWINLEPHRINNKKLKYFAQTLKLNDHDLEITARKLAPLKNALSV